MDAYPQVSSRRVMKPLLLTFVVGLMFTAMFVTGCSGHGRAVGFEPRWDKLVVKVADLQDQQPSGVAVSQSGRVFVAFPYWMSKPRYGVAEVRPDGSLRPIPSDSWNHWDGRSGPSGLRSFVCVQSLYVDDEDYLWVLDAGNPRQRGGLVTAGPKLFKIDLADDTIANVYYIDHKRDLKSNSYLAHVRIDTQNHYAYLSDMGAGALFVMDLKSRDVRHVLHGHASTSAEAGVTPRIGSEQWRGYFGRVPQLGVCGLAMSPDGQWLYYHALTGRTLYRISTASLRDPRLTDGELAGQVQRMADTGSAVDGMWMTDRGDLYLTALERDAILVRRPDGRIETFVADERMQWPDTLAMGPDGYLFVTTSMHHLRPPYRANEKRDRPYVVLKFSIAKVELAIRTWQEAQEARAAAARASEEARAAARQAALKRQRAAAERRAAELRAQEAAAAQAAADAAARAREQALASSQTAAQQQQHAAAAARTAAELAQQKADEARQAARLAAAAAAEAAARAKAAADKFEETRQAQSQHQMTEAQLAQAQAAYERAQAAAAASERYAREVRAASQRRQNEAEKAMQAASEALARAEAEAAIAAQAQAQAAAARAAAEAAAAEARAAEYAELTGRSDHARIESAAVSPGSE